MKYNAKAVTLDLQQPFLLPRDDLNRVHSFALIPNWPTQDGAVDFVGKHYRFDRLVPEYACYGV